MLKTVKVPGSMEPVFAEAERTVGGYFEGLIRDPTKGIISVAGDRYILVRGNSIFSNLYKKMRSEFGAVVTDTFMYDLAKTIGRSDAEHFSSKLDLQEPVQKLSAGPVHFSHTGWAFVDILPESAPSADDNYFLVYNHPNTFESFEYREKKINRPVCLFSAGYSAGWCSHSFGLDVDAEEILCVAKGDEHCRFVMAPPARIGERIADYRKQQGLPE